MPVPFTHLDVDTQGDRAMSNHNVLESVELLCVVTERKIQGAVIRLWFLTGRQMSIKAYTGYMGNQTLLYTYVGKLTSQTKGKVKQR